MANSARMHFSAMAGLILAVLTVAGCAANGEALFHEEGCIQCHRFRGEGGMMGPDLTAVTKRHSDDFIFNYIHNPRASNPHARMPAFSQLSKRKRLAIIAFLKQ
jgi:cytochrome c2